MTGFAINVPLLPCALPGSLQKYWGVVVLSGRFLDRCPLFAQKFKQEGDVFGVSLGELLRGELGDHLDLAAIRNDLADPSGGQSLGGVKALEEPGRFAFRHGNQKAAGGLSITEDQLVFVGNLRRPRDLPLQRLAIPLGTAGADPLFDQSSGLGKDRDGPE